MKKQSRIFILISFLVAWATPGYASLIGDEIQAELLEFGSNLNGPNAHIVGAGPEGSWFGQIGYDLDANTVTVSSLLSAAQNPGTTWIGGLSFSFFDLDWLPVPGQIVGANVISATGVGWGLIDNGDLSFTANSIQINAFDAGGVQVDTNQQVTVELITRHGSVPIPGTIALLGLGFTGLGFLRKK